MPNPDANVGIIIGLGFSGSEKHKQDVKIIQTWYKL